MYLFDNLMLKIYLFQIQFFLDKFFQNFKKTPKKTSKKLKDNNNYKK